MARRSRGWATLQRSGPPAPTASSVSLIRSECAAFFAFSGPLIPPVPLASQARLLMTGSSVLIARVRPVLSRAGGFHHPDAEPALSPDFMRNYHHIVSLMRLCVTERILHPDFPYPQ